jgi:hypothetical protein
MPRLLFHSAAYSALLASAFLHSAIPAQLFMPRLLFHSAAYSALLEAAFLHYDTCSAFLVAAFISLIFS